MSYPKVIEELINYSKSHVILPTTITKAIYDTDTNRRLDEEIEETVSISSGEDNDEAGDGLEDNTLIERDADTLGGKYTANDIARLNKKVSRSYIRKIVTEVFEDDFMMIKRKVNQYISSSDLGTKFSNIQTQIDNQTARLDNLINVSNEEATSKNTELIDIRLGIDGRKYDSAGTSIRTNMTKLSNRIDDNATDIEDLRSYMITVFQQLKKVLNAGEDEEAIAILDSAILDLSKLE